MPKAAQRRVSSFKGQVSSQMPSGTTPPKTGKLERETPLSAFLAAAVGNCRIVRISDFGLWPSDRGFQTAQLPAASGIGPNMLPRKG